MALVQLVILIKVSVIFAIKIKPDLQETPNQLGYEYLPPARYDEQQQQIIGMLPPAPKLDLHTILEQNSILAALLLSASLQPKIPSYNHPEHLPLNPYLALLLSHYGRYSPVYGTGRGIYAYAAVNNYHNNKPFGAYKIYEDNDS